MNSGLMTGSVARCIADLSEGTLREGEVEAEVGRGTGRHRDRKTDRSRPEAVCYSFRPRGLLFPIPRPPNVPDSVGMRAPCSVHNAHSALCHHCAIDGSHNVAKP